jgi:uncharacterized protein
VSRIVSFAIFLSVATSIVGGIHYYLWLRMVRDTGLTGPARLWATVALVVLSLSLPVVAVVGRLVQHPAVKPFVWGAYVWMGLMFLLFVSFVSVDVLRLLVFGGRKVLASEGLPADPERRAALMRLLGGGVTMVSVVSAAVGFWQARATPAVKKVGVSLARLPKTMHGTKLVQISDIHVGPTIGADWLRAVVERVNSLGPDIVAITGDLVDGSVEELREAVAPLRDLSARYGVYFVTGNHEYYSGVDGWLAELTRLGVRVLRNERVTIGAGGDSFELAGIDDSSAHQFGHGHGADLEKALRGYDPGRELVLMAHQPRAIFEAADAKVGLQISGHTHGGQIWPWGYLVRLQQPYVRGLAQHGATQIYVSCGTGYWGPPMRLGAPPEITCLELLAAA